MALYALAFLRCWYGIPRGIRGTQCALGLLLCLSSGCTFCRSTRSEQDLVAVRQLALRGAAAMQRGNSEEAEKCFQDAIARQPQDERGHVLLAELRRRQGRDLESTEHLEKAVQLSGDDPQLLVDLGSQLYEQGDAEGAMNCVAKALKQDSSSFTAWLLYARLLRERRQGGDAIVAYHRALQINPNEREAALELAEVYLREGRLERCLSTLDSRACATAEAEASGRPEYLRGLAYAGMNRHPDAATALAAAEHKGIRSPELYFHLAQAHYESGSPASARLALAEGRKMAPSDDRWAQIATALDAPERGAGDRRRR